MILQLITNKLNQARWLGRRERGRTARKKNTPKKEAPGNDGWTLR